ncbi:reverse transcriptase domain-containing protein [Trichonephila clavipes]|nr:reverse transcriptase domain-containing protein [Trichonephila clavipes]
MAAVISARVGKYLSCLLIDLVVEFRFWTNSLIVLHWIKGCSKQRKQFVRNRVVEIQKKSDPKSWNRCSGRENPADIVSQGASVVHLLQNKLWWLGPDWMCSEQGLYSHYSTKDIPTEML